MATARARRRRAKERRRAAAQTAPLLMADHGHPGQAGEMVGPRANPIVHDPAWPSPSAAETDALRVHQRRLRDDRAHGEPFPHVGRGPAPFTIALDSALLQRRCLGTRREELDAACPKGVRPGQGQVLLHAPSSG
eukprot:12633841-Heterocapsa_arctica.AAC.1